MRHLLSLALCQAEAEGKPEDVQKTLAKALELATAANLPTLRVSSSNCLHAAAVSRDAKLYMAASSTRAYLVICGTPVEACPCLPGRHHSKPPAPLLPLTHLRAICILDRRCRRLLVAGRGSSTADTPTDSAGCQSGGRKAWRSSGRCQGCRSPSSTCPSCCTAKTGSPGWQEEAGRGTSCCRQT